MPTIHLVEGPVGAGKSTFAGQLSLRHSIPFLNLDEWMANLFRPDRPRTDFMAWYTERKQRCVHQLWLVAAELMESGTSVVLELGLVRRPERDDFYQRVDGAGYALQVYVLDAPKTVRKDRVLARNRDQGSTFKMEVPEDIFELANAAWEPPEPDEIAARGIEFVGAAGND